MPTENPIDISGGQNQIATGPTTQQQIFYGDQFARQILRCNNAPLTLVVLGAGADATLGLPTSAQLIPRIVSYLETDEGKTIDTLLRKAIGSVRFHFDKFVSQAIDGLAKDLDKNLVTICRNISDELNNNASLSPHQQKMGQLIVRLFRKIIDIKAGATIDSETEALINEVFETTVKDDTIIDFNHLNYTDTFKSLIVEILQRSMHETDNPILRHVYRNILDVEQLLSKYFYGFYTNRVSYVRDYLYISWILWSYLVSQEQQIAQQPPTESPTNAPQSTLYQQLQATESPIITFNYTSLARQASPTALYFHGSLMEYVDVENQNDLIVGDLSTLNLPDFLQHRLSHEISFDPAHLSLPIPSFLPPLKLQPVLSKHYIETWYQASQLMLRATKLIIMGYSFASADAYFSDLLRTNRHLQLIIIDKDIDTVSRHLCSLLHLPQNHYTTQHIAGQERRIYDNRITLVAADLSEVNVKEWV